MREREAEEIEREEKEKRKYDKTDNYEVRNTIIIVRRFVCLMGNEYQLIQECASIYRIFVSCVFLSMHVCMHSWVNVLVCKRGRQQIIKE